MENCPACNKEFRGIEDFPRVRILCVERGDLEGLINIVHEKTAILSDRDERLSAEEWKFLQKIESQFSNAQNVKKDIMGEYIEVGNSFDDFFGQELKKDAQRNAQELAEGFKKLHESRIYREQLQEPAKAGKPQYKYFLAEPQDKLVEHLKAYVSKLESLANTVVEPKELLNAELERTLVFRESPEGVEEVMHFADGREILNQGGTKLTMFKRTANHKSPRETSIYFGEYGRARGMGFVSPTGSAIAIIKYEGLLAEAVEAKGQIL